MTAPAPQAAEPKAEASAPTGDGDIWLTLMESYKNRLTPDKRAFVGQADGRLANGVLTVYCPTAVTKAMLDTEAVAAVLREAGQSPCALWSASRRTEKNATNFRTCCVWAASSITSTSSNIRRNTDMAKGYSARRGFSNGAGQAAQQMQMQQKLMQMQQEMAKAQQEVEEATFTASVGGGAVSAAANGKKEITALTIKPEAVDPEDVEMLQDLVISAVNEALRQADDAMSSRMNSFTSGLNIPGLGL